MSHPRLAKLARWGDTACYWAGWHLEEASLRLRGLARRLEAPQPAPPLIYDGQQWVYDARRTFVPEDDQRWLGHGADIDPTSVKLPPKAEWPSHDGEPCPRCAVARVADNPDIMLFGGPPHSGGRGVR